MQPINEAIQSLEAALKQVTETTLAKAAYKKIKTAHEDLQKYSFVPEQVLIAKAEELLAFDSQICCLGEKYRYKIHTELQCIRLKKTFWAAQPLLTPHCMHFYFAGEDTHIEKPLVLPMQTFELLKANSDFFQLDMSPFSEKNGVHLREISRRHFLIIIEHLLTNNAPEIAEDEIVDIVRALGVLGISKLENFYLRQLRDALTNQSWEDLLTVMCETCSETYLGEKFSDTVYMAVREVQHRHLLSAELLKHTSTQDFITAFCENKKISQSEFWARANTNMPQFSLENKMHTSDPIIAAYKALNSRSKIECLPTDPQKRKWLARPMQAPVIFLRQHPSLWLSKQAEEIDQGKVDLNQILKEIALFKAEHAGHITDKLERKCCALEFLCLLYQRHDAEALEYVKQSRFGYEDLPVEKFHARLSYCAFLLEQGLYDHPALQKQPKPDWLKKLENLYQLEVPTFISSEDEICREVGIYDLFRAKPYQYDERGGSMKSKGFKVYCEEHPNDIFPRLYYAHCLWNDGKLEEFFQTCNEVLAKQKNAVMLFRRCLYYRRTNQLELAEKDARDLLEAHFSFKHLHLVTDLLCERHGLETALEFLSGVPTTAETQLCHALWTRDKTALEQIKDEKNADYALVKAVLYDSFVLFQTGIISYQNHAGLFREMLSWANRVSFQELKLVPSEHLLDRSNQMRNSRFPSLQAEFNQEHHRYIETFHKLCNREHGKLQMPLNHKYAWLHFYKIVNGNPIEIPAKMREIQPYLPAPLLALLPVIQAHREGDYDTVIALANEQSPEEALLAADAHRRKGNLEKAKALLATHLDPAAKVILDAIRLQEDPNSYYPIVNSSLRLERYVYHPFIELAYLVAAKNESNKPNFGKISAQKQTLGAFYTQITLMLLSSEAIHYLQQQNLLEGYDLLAFRRRGYRLGELEGQLHEQLASEKKYGLMDSRFLANSPVHRGVYGKYLYFHNRFEEALGPLIETNGNVVWIGECYEATGNIKMAREYYEKATDQPAALNRAEMLKTKKERSVMDPAIGVGDYLDAHKLYQAGRHAELCLRFEKPLTMEDVKAKGLYVHFFIAQSKQALDNTEHAKAAITEILKYSTRAADLYGQAFFDEVLNWSKANGMSLKKQRI